MNLPSLKEYLKKVGVTETTPTEVVATHRKEHKRLYNRHYAQQRRRNKVRMESELTKSKFRKLKGFAKRYKREAVNRFLVDCAFAYLEDEALEHNLELTRELVRQIRAIGNNVNQVVHQLHRTKAYQHQGFYQHLKDRIDHLELTIVDFIKTPPKLKGELENLFEQVPESIHDFERFLENMKSKHLGYDS